MSALTSKDAIILSVASKPIGLAMRIASIFSWVAFGIALMVIAGALFIRSSYNLSSIEWSALSLLALVFVGAGIGMRLISKRHKRVIGTGKLITLDAAGIHDHRDGNFLLWSDVQRVHVDHIGKLFGAPTLLIAPELVGLLANPKAKLVSSFEGDDTTIKIPWSAPLVPPPAFQAWVGERLREAGRETVATAAEL